MIERPKTIFCDIDGTLWEHVGQLDKHATCNNYKLCNNTLNAISLWDKQGYQIILTTGRKESLRKVTEENLQKNGIVYDRLIMGLGGGDRILINDRKPDNNRNTAYAINLVRNSGLQIYDFSNKFVVISDNQPKLVDKPWGTEELIEYNDHYVVKKLFIKKEEYCSMQYHELKRKTIYILSGKIKLYLGTLTDDINNLNYKILGSNDNITIEPYTIHRVEGIEDSYYLETSTNELWDDVKL
jgi:mannose-6-phosphate isomerase